MSTPDRYNEELFLGYLEGDLTPEQVAEFEKLLVEDARLRNLVAQMVLDRHRLRKLPDEEAPVEMMDAVDRAMERRMLLGAPAQEAVQQGVRRMRLGRVLMYSGIAAMFVLVAGLIARTLFDGPLIRMAENTKTPPGPVAISIEPASRSNDAPVDLDGKSGPATPSAKQNEQPLERTAMGLARGTTTEGVDTRPQTAVTPAPTGPTVFGGQQAQGGGGRLENYRPDAPHSKDVDSSSALAAAKKVGEASTPPESGAGNTSRTMRPAGQVADATSADKGKAASKPSAVKTSAATGKAPGESFRSSDVPIAPMAQEELNRLHDAGRIQLTTATLETGQRDIVAWAQQRNVRIVSIHTNETASRDAVTDVEKMREVNSKAEITTAAGEKVDAKRVEQSKTAAGTSEVVLVLAPKQVTELVTHLNTQQGRSAELQTKPVVMARARSEPAESKTKSVKESTSDEVSELERRQSQADSLADRAQEPAKTAPAVGAASATPGAPAAPAPPPAAKPTEGVVKLSIIITSAPIPATAPAHIDDAASKAPAKD